MKTATVGTPKKSTKKSHREGRPPANVVQQLLLEHGGRCAICNKWLADDPSFFLQGNYRETAHIIPASDDGPRAHLEILSPTERHAIENLLPLCFDHHNLVDDRGHLVDFPPERLRKIKADHKRTIQYLCEQASRSPSLIVHCQANLGGTKVAVTPNIVAMALNGKRPLNREGLLIDFTKLTGSETPEDLRSYARELERQVSRALTANVSGESPSHVSIFAIGPIPLLVALGAAIGRALPTECYHRNSALGTWPWPSNGTRISFETKMIRPGDGPEAAILVSCTGNLDHSKAMSHLAEDCPIYEIIPTGTNPRPDLIDHPESISEFISAYNQLRAELNRTKRPRKLHLFHASPPAIVVATGQHLFAKVDPTVLVYDYRKHENGYVPILEVNQ